MLKLLILLVTCLQIIFDSVIVSLCNGNLWLFYDVHLKAGSHKPNDLFICSWK